ncbi:DUF814 domain-containing protein [Candidatus Woesearchaeota archaeon]|nr:MAG: DUF814 domain-containing protein [Candidatus Woesearchaeota archaeon]
MEITLDLNKSIEENASSYFEKAKKAKKKLLGAQEAAEQTRKRIEQLERKKEKELAAIKKESVRKREKKWYEKFRWFHSSEGFLVIGGRDATTNEIIIKKHTNDDDIVFHTDMAGSPFFVVKTVGKKVGEATLKEAAQATASYSRAWKLGLGTSDVFYVKPSQVTKEAKAGEFMPKGAFMIKGKTTYIRPEIKLAIGEKNGEIIGGPVDSIKKQTKNFVVIVQGAKKPSEVAKKIRAKLGGDIDEIIRMLPAGGCEIEK